MNILVTGANGFLGHYLRAELKKYENHHMLLLTSSETTDFSYILHKNYTYEVNDFQRCAIDRIDAVIHMGAAVPRSSDENQIKPYIENIKTTEYLLTHLPNIPEKIIYISSVMVYKPTKERLSEASEVSPHSLYGTSKLFCEQLITSWAQENHVTPIILRIGQVYGAGQKNRLLIQTMISKALQNEPMLIFSDGTEKRSFIHATDVACAICHALQLAEPDIINIVTDESFSVFQVASIIKNLTKSSSEIMILNEMKNTVNYFYNNAVMREKLFSPQVQFEDGLKQEIRFMQTGSIAKESYGI